MDAFLLQFFYDLDDNLFLGAWCCLSFSLDPSLEELSWCFDKGTAGSSPVFNRLIIKAALPGLPKP